MRAPDGYTLRKVLVALPRKCTCLAVRDRDQTEVLLKAYPGDAGVSQIESRARREFGILRSLPPGTAPMAFALEASEELPVVVLERLTGSAPRGPLARRPEAQLTPS